MQYGVELDYCLWDLPSHKTEAVLCDLIIFIIGTFWSYRKIVLHWWIVSWWLFTKLLLALSCIIFVLCFSQVWAFSWEREREEWVSVCVCVCWHFSHKNSVHAYILLSSLNCWKTVCLDPPVQMAGTNILILFLMLGGKLSVVFHQ